MSTITADRLNTNENSESKSLQVNDWDTIGHTFQFHSAQFQEKPTASIIYS